MAELGRLSSSAAHFSTVSRSTSKLSSSLLDRLSPHMLHIPLVCAFSVEGRQVFLVPLHRMCGTAFDGRYGVVMKAMYKVI
jgi:hypothetical protein